VSITIFKSAKIFLLYVFFISSIIFLIESSKIFSIIPLNELPKRDGINSATLDGSSFLINSLSSSSDFIYKSAIYVVASSLNVLIFG